MGQGQVHHLARHRQPNPELLALVLWAAPLAPERGAAHAKRALELAVGDSAPPIDRLALPAALHLASWGPAERGSGVAAQALKSAVLAALSARAVTRPEPPADATRSVEGLRCSCRDCGALRSFVVNARRYETEFRVAQRRREHLRSSACGLDLSFETLRVGSPFRLQVRKTMASFERALARYEADQATVTRLRSELAATD